MPRPFRMLARTPGGAMTCDGRTGQNVPSPEGVHPIQTRAGWRVFPRTPPAKAKPPGYASSERQPALGNRLAPAGRLLGAAAPACASPVVSTAPHAPRTRSQSRWTIRPEHLLNRQDIRSRRAGPVPRGPSAGQLRAGPGGGAESIPAVKAGDDPGSRMARVTVKAAQQAPDCQHASDSTPAPAAENSHVRQ
jgi:hypothetical protein